METPEEFKERMNRTDEINRTQEEVTIPLSFEKDEYDIRLEPLARYNENQEFAVSMKCKRTFAITSQAFQAVKEVDKIVEMEAETVLRTCLKTGIPKGVIKRVINEIVKSRENTCSAEWFDFANEIEKRLNL